MTMPSDKWGANGATRVLWCLPLFLGSSALKGTDLEHHRHSKMWLSTHRLKIISPIGNVCLLFFFLQMKEMSFFSLSFRQQREQQGVNQRGKMGLADSSVATPWSEVRGKEGLAVPSLFSIAVQQLLRGLLKIPFFGISKQQNKVRQQVGRPHSIRRTFLMQNQPKIFI